jgi:hypothetical protein
MTFFSLVGNSYFLCDKLGNVFFFSVLGLRCRVRKKMDFIGIPHIILSLEKHILNLDIFNFLYLFIN